MKIGFCFPCALYSTYTCLGLVFSIYFNNDIPPDVFHTYKEELATLMDNYKVCIIGCNCALQNVWYYPASPPPDNCLRPTMQPLVLFIVAHCRLLRSTYKPSASIQIHSDPYFAISAAHLYTYCEVYTAFKLTFLCVGVSLFAKGSGLQRPAGPHRWRAFDVCPRCVWER